MEAAPRDTPCVAGGVRVALALGSNLGESARWVRDGVAAIARQRGVWLEACSGLYATTPVGPVRQAAFVNAAAIVRTTLSPRELLGAMQAIELSCGRDRGAGAQRWGPRTLDIDIVAWGEQRVAEAGLTVPHPHMHERGFVLVPLAAVAPGLRVPMPDGLRTVEELLRALPATDGAVRSLWRESMR